MTVTLVRYLFGLPFATLYLIFLFKEQTVVEVITAVSNQRFVVFSLLAGIAQIIATVLLVKVFSFRNFAVGTSFAKTEAIQTAIFGMIVFGTALTFLGWIAVLVGFVGILVVSVPRSKTPWDLKNVALGTLSGTAFSFTSLWLREASLSLSNDALHSAGMTLFFMVSVQTLICLIYVSVKEPGQLNLMFARFGLATFVGLTSALGSIGWFTGMTLTNPALVKSVGQVEFIFTLIITTVFFKEKISTREYIGMAFIVISVLILLQ